MKLIITGKCPNLEGKGHLGFEISITDKGPCLKITDNSGGGTYSGEPIPILNLFECVKDKQYFRLNDWSDLIPGKNNNTQGFACAVLLHIGVVEKVDGGYAFVSSAATGTVIFEGKAASATMRLSLSDAV